VQQQHHQQTWVDLNNNAEIEAANFASNFDSDGDSLTDSQNSGMSCWTCHS